MIQNNNQSMVKTFFQYSIPCIIGMFLTSFITIIDGMFIGWKMGTEGLAAVNLNLPVLYILLALTIMTGVGGVTLGAQSLGNKNNLHANHYFTVTMIINLFINFAVMLILILWQEPIIRLLNAKGILKELVRDYLGTMKFFYLFMMLNLSFSMFIRGEGKPQLSLMFGIIANILNIVLDYLFIFKFNLGMKGAALASGISVIIAFILGVLYFFSKHSVYKFTRIKIIQTDLKKIIFLGSAEFITQLSVSIITYVFNWVLLGRIGIEGVAAMTIVGYVSFIQSMILTGIAVGIHPVISYFFGAGNNKAVLELISIAFVGVISVGVFAFGIVHLGGDGIVGIFSKERGTFVRTAVIGLKIFSFSFIFNGYNIITAAYFTSRGEAKKAAVISALRSLFLVMIFVMLLPPLIGDAGIWLTVPITELLVFVLAYYWIKKSRKELHSQEFGNDLSVT